jgi:hypothetical protein
VDLGREIALPVGGLDHQLEEPLGIARELDPNAATTIDPCTELRLLDRL